MANSLLKKPTRVAQINGLPVVVNHKETVLHAALRAGVDFPNSCRVGGCGACKCRLASGQVTELTETGYLLSAAELEQGYILACQSVPRSDVTIEVDLSSQAGVRGVVTGWQRMTHDIVELRVQLDEPMHYEPGQFANVSIEGLEGVERSYSFAAPQRADAQVSFFIRKVGDGPFSSLVNEHDVRGRAVELTGPYGDFWLRPDSAPLLLIAGGSGLAPILAILREAAARGAARSVTLVFGARAQRDLYALAEIEATARRWRGAFRFVPVLSEESADSEWSGARGLVTERLAELIEPHAHAYLCGPTGMIDGVLEVLSAQGLSREHVHFDKFTTQADAAAVESPRPAAQLSDYLKYFTFHFVGLLAAAALVIGGAFVTAGLLAVVALYMIGDAYLGDDTSTPQYKHPGVLTMQLWLALPLIALIVFTGVWTVCSGDPLGFGAGISGLIGYDVVAWRDATTFPHHVSAWLITGLMIGMVGTITAHELTHRTWDPISMFIGRWLLAFSFDTSFAIEHVYGHHRYVSTTEDPATAPRGRNVYHHVVASTIKGNISAWHIERERLQKKKLAVWSLRNAVLRGYLMSALLVLAAWWLGGTPAAAFFIACALWGKALLEIVNYMEHYGIVRNPATPVQPRHSWNTNKRISSWAMFNLTRHSHHHAQGEVPYQDLRPYPNAPMMINGYLTTIVIALIPPLWHRLMIPKVLAWDRDFATAEERELATQANARSGIAALQQANVGQTESAERHLAA